MAKSSRATTAPTRVAEVVEILEDEIVTGRLQPGKALRLEPIAERLGVSMMPVREALRQLESLGLVEQRPRRGARVSHVSIKDLYDTYEARLALESMAVHRAAERFTPEDEERLDDLLNQYANAVRESEAVWRKIHTELHFAIYRAADSDWLIRLITPLWANSERYRVLSLPLRGSAEARRVEHERIVDACRQHNAQLAVRELRNHLATTANLVARQFDSPDLF